MSAMLRETSLVEPVVEQQTEGPVQAGPGNAARVATGSQPQTVPPAPPPGDGVSQDQRAAGIQNRTRRAVYEDHRRDQANLQFDLREHQVSARRFTETWQNNRERYERVAQATGVPAELIAAIHFRESSGNFGTYLHNGQRLGQVTTAVPRGKFFTDWEAAAIDALREKGGIARDLQMNAQTTDLAAMATFAEYYNGLGYHNRGGESPYVYSGTNNYDRGKYVADGRYDPNHRDQQLGVVAMIQLARGEIDRRGRAATPGAQQGPTPTPGAASGGTEAAPPAPTSGQGSPAAEAGGATRRMVRQGSAGREVAEVQRLLNRMGAGLETDGLFGPLTTDAIVAFQRRHGLEVDGVVGPDTWAALLQASRNPQPGRNRGRNRPGRNQRPNERQPEDPPVSETRPARETAQGQPAPEGSTEARLQEFFNQFNGIGVRVNPGEEPPRFVDVIPPYHINSGTRQENAAAARAANPAVRALINELPMNARVGKATPADVQRFLERSIAQGLLTDTTPRGMRDYLARYGVSTDCSGLVTQALNHLNDGNMQIDPSDPLQPVNVGSGSLRGGQGQFDRVAAGNLRAGDTMHIPGHIRIVMNVRTEGEYTYFRTMESTPAEDVVEPSQRDANDQRRADGGRYRGLRNNGAPA